MVKVQPELERGVREPIFDQLLVHMPTFSDAWA